MFDVEWVGAVERARRVSLLVAAGAGAPKVRGIPVSGDGRSRKNEPSLRRRLAKLDPGARPDVPAAHLNHRGLARYYGKAAMRMALGKGSGRSPVVPKKTAA